MLFQKTKFIPISSLVYDKVILEMEESAAPKPKRIFPDRKSVV